MNTENGREIVFPFEDYSTQRQAVSNQLASLILNQAEDILGKIYPTIGTAKTIKNYST